MVTIGVSSSDEGETVGCAEGYTGSKDSWREFLSWLRGADCRTCTWSRRGKCAGMLDALDEMQPAAPGVVHDGVGETLAYTDFPPKHWHRIRTNNDIKRINHKIKRRTRVVDTFPDGNSALMLVTARLKYIAENK